MPANRFIFLLCFVRKPIMATLLVEDNNEKANNGKPRPNPNARKLMIFARNSGVVVARAKKAAMSPGLQGKTIAPKKNPNVYALTNGFLEIFGV